MLVATVTCAQRKGSIMGAPEECNLFKVICKVSFHRLSSETSNFAPVNENFFH